MPFEPWPDESIPAGPVTEAHIDKILRIMELEIDHKKKSGLRRKINSLWQKACEGAKFEDSMLPHKRLERFERVQKAASELHEALNYTPPGSVWPVHVYLGQDVQDGRDAVLGVARIEKWAA